MRKKKLIIILLLCSAISTGLYAQCDVDIQVQESRFDISVKTPQPGLTYSWATDNGHSGSGTSFSIPRSAGALTIFRDGAPASRISFEAESECLLEIGGFSYTNPDACQSCTYKFVPLNNNALSHLWYFGDGSPTSTEAMPTHTYSASGIYTVTHTVTYSTGSGIATAVCSQIITVVCGISSQVGERVECCRLYLRLCGSGQIGCSHLWEVLNASSQTVLSSTDVSPEFVLANINTYVNNTVTIRHTTVCNGVTDVQTFPYVIQSRGIFVGDPALPVTSVVKYSTVTGPLNNNQPLFPAFTVTNQNVYIQNVLEIDVTPVTFERDQVCFANDAGIDVAANRTLNVKTANRLYNGCTQAWRGIVVRGRLDMNGNPPGGGAGQENEVKGAVFAVRPEGANANVTLVRTNFDQNFIGLYADVAFTSYIQNNRFVGTSLPPLGATSIAAVSAETGGYSQTGAFAGVFVRNITFNNIYKNQFVTIANGYYLLNTNGTISNDEFINMHINDAYASGRTGHGIYFRHDGGVGRLTATANFFANLQTGIRAISATPGTQVVIGGFPGASNTVGNVRFGFMLEQWVGGRFQNSAVSYNNAPSPHPNPGGGYYTVDSRRVGIGFRCDPGASLVSNVDIFNNNVGIKVAGGDGILLEGPNPGTGNITVRNNKVSLHHTGGRSGIHLLNFRGAQVEGNTVTINTFHQTKGIWLEASANNTIDANTVTYNQQPVWSVNGIQLDNSPSNAVTNNHIHNTGAALLFNGDCSAQNQIRCNHFHNSLYGMHYTDMARTGDQENTGNRWESAGYNPGGGLTGARHDSPDKLFVQLSQYLTLQGTSTQYPRTFELQPGILPSDWFVPGSDAPCGPTPPQVISEGEELAAGAGIATGNDFEDGYNWVSRRLLYRKLRENPALVSSSATVQNFYQGASGTNVGAYDHVDERLMTAVPLSAAAEQELQTYQSAADNAAAVMAAKEDAIWNGNLTEAELQILLDEFAAAASDYAAANAQINTLLANWRSGLSAEIDGAGAENAGLHSVETWDSREKALNTLWLGKVRNGQWLTGADLAYIRETAQMCPWDGGFGVYKARMLWQRLSDEALTPSDCAGTYREGPKQAKVAEFRLYPNPAQGQVALELPAEWTRGGAVQYRLYNTLGALAHSGTAAEGAERVLVSLAGLPNGLYVCQVLCDGRVLGTTKLSTVKN